LWDAVLAALRRTLRGDGLKECPTPVRVLQPAVEPWIEPIAASGQWLQTSPELAMKRLIAAGSGPIFQIAPVFRRAEMGAWHREEFRLLEWYRVGDTFERVRHDVERLVSAAFAAARSRGGCAVEPVRWETHRFEALFAATTGYALVRDMPVAALGPLLADVSRAPAPPLRAGDDECARVERWTQLFTAWSDVHLDPWLARRADEGVAIHIVDFPAPLAALSEVRDNVARRFESYLGGRELANGYCELRQSREQRRRFDAVNRLRAAYDAELLPLDDLFIEAVDRLPPCSGVALGVDRLVALCVGARDLAEVALVVQDAGEAGPS